MSITIVNGDLLNSHCDYICHQVNCAGAMNSGVAKAIRNKWPVVFEKYREWYMSYEAWGYAQAGYYGDDSDQMANELKVSAMLGDIQVVALYDDYNSSIRHQHVINMAAQGSYGYDGKRYTSYDAFWMCLGKIKAIVPKGSSIAFPYLIGCCRGGANWNVIYEMIKQVLSSDYEVFLYKLEE